MVVASQSIWIFSRKKLFEFSLEATRFHVDINCQCQCLIIRDKLYEVYEYHFDLVTQTETTSFSIYHLNLFIILRVRVALILIYPCRVKIFFCVCKDGYPYTPSLNVCMIASDMVIFVTKRTPHLMSSQNDNTIVGVAAQKHLH